MRVALVASLVSPIRPAEANGPHAVIVDLARGLAARGHEATIYAAEGSTADGCRIVEVPVDAAAAAASVRVGGRPSATALRALDRGFVRLFEEVRADRPEVVSQHAFDASPFGLADGLPTVHTLHLPPMEDGVLAAARRTEGRLATVSRHARRAWQRATGRDVTLLPNGVRDLEPAGGPTLPVALIAGRIAPEKGTDAGIRAARRAGLAVLVVGDVYDPHYHASAVAPLLRPAELVGALSREALFQLMARSAVLLMPIAWDEPFGLVAAEAQMAGCPVVAYRRGALPEVVPHAVGGWLVDPGEEAGLVDAVRSARTLDRRAIRERARRELGVDRMVDAYERELLATAARGTARAS
ncbi:MAG TPA: glycosyltransferase [Candidatus Limnocylindria bacterium]|nr:glycosyltransferase [Candidatus Limnocylindria bacterium]